MACAALAMNSTATVRREHRAFTVFSLGEGVGIGVTSALYARE
jgi:hypothetical protein